MVSNESGTYARAPYAFAALGQGPKGPELVCIYNICIRSVNFLGIILSQCGTVGSSIISQSNAEFFFIIGG